MPELPSASGLVMISASISIALCVCERANSITSRNSFGEPPGLPEIPFGNGFDGPGVPQLLNHGEQTLRVVTGSGGRLHFGMVAGIKSERRPTSNRKAWPDCLGIRTRPAPNVSNARNSGHSPTLWRTGRIDPLL